MVKQDFGKGQLISECLFDFLRFSKKTNEKVDKFLPQNLQSGQIIKQRHYTTLSSSYNTVSWELWKHPDPAPGGRPMFFKAKLPKESKNGFKTISCRCFFKKLFSAPKIIKRIGCFVDFWIFISIYMLKIRPVLKNLIARNLESVKILPKC